MLFLKKRKDTIVVFLIIDVELIYVVTWHNEERLTKSQTFRLLLLLLLYKTVMGQVNKIFFFLTQNLKVRLDVIKFIY